MRAPSSGSSCAERLDLAADAVDDHVAAAVRRPAAWRCRCARRPTARRSRRLRGRRIPAGRAAGPGFRRRSRTGAPPCLRRDTGASGTCWTTTSGSSSLRARDRDHLRERRVLDDGNRPEDRIAPRDRTLNRLAHLGLRQPDAPRPGARWPRSGWRVRSRRNAIVNESRFSTSTRPFRSNSTPRGARSGIVRR